MSDAIDLSQVVWDPAPGAIQATPPPPQPPPVDLSQVVWDPVPAAAPVAASPAPPPPPEPAAVPIAPGTDRIAAAATGQVRPGTLSSLIAPPEPAPQEGFFTGIGAGLQETANIGRRLVTGQTFEPTQVPPAPQGEPGFFYEVGKGVGMAPPAIAAGLGGMAAGAAIGAPFAGFGAVPGAAIGGTLGLVGGSGLVSAAMDLAPQYDAAIQRGMSHDDAVNYAWTHGAATGVISGLAAAIPGGKTIVGNLLKQAFVAQPAGGLAVRTGVPALMGEPQPSAGELVRGAAQDVLTGAAFGAGHAAYTRGRQAAEARYDSPLRRGTPTPEDVARTATAPGNGPAAEALPARPPIPGVDEPTPAPTPEVTPPVPEQPYQQPASQIAPGTEQPVTTTVPPTRFEPTQTVDVTPPVTETPVTETPVTPRPGVEAGSSGAPGEPILPRQEPPLVLPEAGGAPRQEPVVAPRLPGEPLLPTEPSVEPQQPEGVRPTEPTVPAYRTEPDDVNIGQHVAKDEQGRVVGKGGTPEAAAADAQRRGGEVYPPEQPAPTVAPATEPTAPTTAAPATEPTAPTAEPTTYGPGNVHPESIGGRINTLEQLGRDRTPEQTAELQDLHAQRAAAEQNAYREFTDLETRRKELATQIDAQEKVVQRLQNRNPYAVNPSKPLVRAREQLQTMYDQRREIEAARREVGKRNTLERDRAVYGPPEPVSEHLSENLRVSPRDGETAPRQEPLVSGQAPVESALPGGTKTPPISSPQTLRSPVEQQIDRLMSTRDALAAKANPTRADRQRLSSVQSQLDKALASWVGGGTVDARRGGGTPGGPRRGGFRQPFEGAPEAGRKPDYIDYHFNDGTSVYREVFREAGHDPDQASRRPIEWQNEVLSQHMVNKFGFKSVTLEGSAGREPTPSEQVIARDAMLDMTRALTDGMAVANLPHEAASHFGELRLVLQPQGRFDHTGQYVFDGTIKVVAGASSFGHEWTHATDHLLAERFTGNPRDLNDLLSRYARGTSQLQPGTRLNVQDRVQAEFANLLNKLFYNDAAFAAQRLSLETQAQKVDRLGNPTQGALQARDQLARLEAGGSRLQIQPSEFRQQSATLSPSDYWASAHEMLARSHEAYLAWRSKAAGVDPRGWVMPDEAYINETDRQLHRAYPKLDERQAIFDAWDKLHDALRNEQILTRGQPAAKLTNMGVSDPGYHGVTAPQTSKTALARALRTEYDRWSKLTETIAKERLTDPTRADPGHLTRGVRFVDAWRAVLGSAHGRMDTIIQRSPDAAKPYLQHILDTLAPAPGSGRYTRETFEEAIRRRSRDWMRRYANIMAGADLRPSDLAPGAVAPQMLRHFMVTGETTFDGQAIPQTIQRAGGRLTVLMDEMWRASRNAGMDIGYASQYYPRLYDLAKIYADNRGFHARASQLYKLMFDREVGTPGNDPIALLEKWTTLSRAQRELVQDPALPGMMRDLQRNLARQRELEAQPTRTPAEDAELRRLGQEAANLAGQAHDPLGDHVALLSANDWLNNVNRGGHADFDTTGPANSYLKARQLPPEADIIMAPFMHLDPHDAIPNYVHAVSRRIAFAERYGQHGEELEKAFKHLSSNSLMRAEDLQQFEGLVKMVTGRPNDRGWMMRDLQKISNVVHALGAVSLMPRAVWSSLSEPMAGSLATGEMQHGLRTFGNLFGQMMRTKGPAGAEARTELADFLSVTVSAMHDSIMMSRMSADYSDSPRIARFMTAYYRTTGLTQLTNAQRAAAVGSNNWFLTKLANSYLDRGNTHAGEDAGRWFRELGLPDRIHGEFSQFMRDLQGGMPTIDELRANPGMQSAYSLAMRRLTDRVIQDPYKVDRATMSNLPVLGLAFQLMSFNYQFQRNVLNPAWDRITHTGGRARQEALAAGAGGLSATLQGAAAGAGTLVHAAAMASTMVGAAFMVSAVRQYLFAPDQWQKHEEDGTLGEYLTGLAFGRSGLNGVMDPLVQIATSLKYQADLSSLLEGAAAQWFTHNAQDVIQPLVTTNDSPNTNTRLYNQARGMFNLVGIPAAAYGLTMLGSIGGPLTRVAAGAALQFGTSPGAAATVAETVAGPKGAEREKETTGLANLQKMQGLQSLAKLGAAAKEDAGGEGSSAGLIPWGLVDDFMLPLWRFGAPLVTALPGPLKVGAGVAGAGYAGAKYLEETAPFRDQPAPERKPAKAR